MRIYSLWVYSCKHENEDTELQLLKEHDKIRLFKLIKNNNVTYHIWNVISCEYHTTSEYNDAVKIYNNFIDNSDKDTLIKFEKIINKFIKPNGRINRNLYITNTDGTSIKIEFGAKIHSISVCED